MSRWLLAALVAGAHLVWPARSGAQVLSVTGGISKSDFRKMQGSGHDLGGEDPDRTAATLGLRAEFFVRPSLTIIGDARRVPRRGSLFGSRSNIQYAADYLELSPRLAVHTGDRGPRGTASVGPYLALKVRDVPTLTQSEPLASHDFGVLLTVGVSNTAGRVVPMAEAQCAFGVSGLTRHRSSDTGRNLGRTTTLSLVVGVGVRVGRIPTTHSRGM
jgi:hypothetical protein